MSPLFVSPYLDKPQTINLVNNEWDSCVGVWPYIGNFLIKITNIPDLLLIITNH